MTLASALHPHQSRADRAEHLSGVAPTAAGVAVEPVGNPLQYCSLVAERQRADDLGGEDGQDAGHCIGHHLGRRTRDRLKRVEA